MKTTREIIYENSKYCHKWIIHSQCAQKKLSKKWFSKKDIKDDLEIFIEEQLYEGYEEDIVREFVKYLFELKPKDAPDLNSRSSDEDSLNKGYEVNQK